MNYWLSPTGKFWEVSSSEHNTKAVTIIEERHKVFCDKDGLITSDNFYNAVSILESVGYIRYVGWGRKPQWVIFNQKPTKIQIQRMFELTNFIYEE